MVPIPAGLGPRRFYRLELDQCRVPSAIARIDLPEDQTLRPEAAAPEEDSEPEPEPEEDPNRPLTAADLVAVYDDPSAGIMLHRTKNGDRWFLTQVDPMSGQPRTMPLHPEDVKQIKQQLEGSPYWILGA